MGRKAWYTVEQKVKACEEYLSGKTSAAKIANELEMGKQGKSKIREWSRLFRPSQVNSSTIMKYIKAPYVILTIQPIEKQQLVS